MSVTRRKALSVWAIATCLCLLWLAHGTYPRMAQDRIQGFRAMTQGVLAGQDTLSHDYPAMVWGWQQIRQSGRIPLWNPAWFGGQPFVASQTFMAFYPPNALGLVLPFPFAFNFQYLLHLALAGWVMGHALRRRGYGLWIAGWGGLAWAASGHLATLVGPGHLQKLQAIVWLPWVAGGLGDLLSGSPRGRRSIWTFGAGLTLQVLAGHLQIVYLSLAMGTLEGLGRWGLRGLAMLNRKRHGQIAPLAVASHRKSLLKQSMLRLALALGFAVGLSAIFWLPTIEFAGTSNRQAGLSYDEAILSSMPPEEAFEWCMPRLLGDSMPHGRGVYLGRFGENNGTGGERIISDYVGASVLLLMLAALTLPHRRRKASWAWFLFGACLLWLIGGGYHPQFHPLALKLIPGLDRFRSPATMMVLFTYACVLMSCAGLAAASRPQSKRAIRTLSLAPLIVYFLIVFHLKQFDRLETLPKGLPHPASGTLSQLSYALIAVSGALEIYRRSRASARGLRLVAFGVFVFVTFADLAYNARPFWNSTDAAPYEIFLTQYEPVQSVGMQYTRAGRGPARYLELGNERSNRSLTLNDFTKQQWFGSPLGYHPVHHQRIVDLNERLGPTHPTTLKLLAVSMLIADDQPSEGYQPLGGSQGRRLWVHESKPYATPVMAFQIADDWPTMLQAWQEGLDPAAATQVTPKAIVAIKQADIQGFTPHNLPTIKATPIRAGKVELAVDSPAKGWVVVREPYGEQWQASRQGVLLETLPVDGLFFAVPVAQGAQVITLEYAPWSQRIGTTITVITLFALLGLIWVRQKKRPTIAPASS